MARKFKGKIKLDIRDSKPDWPAFLDAKTPKGAPNILVILYDDTGQAAWSPYGGRIEMPTLDRLARNGLTYTQWHTTAVCSPTRSTFLTGRNHHQNGCGSISESAVGFPGYSGHIPPENATIATILRNAGYSTFWVGKNHNVPVDGFGIAANRKSWPLGLGYDRFYGFIGGETNQWYPELIEDNHFVEQPYTPEEGYHFSKDIADKAIQFITDTRQSRPEKPWYLWLCPGANHAPHHAPKEYIEKYKGKFDDGYGAYREWVLKRMKERGILPKDTDLTPLNPMAKGTYSEGDSARPWSSLSTDERKLFCRMAEVYAAFSEYTDVQLGRVIDYLEQSGQLENTLILYCADNGASGEGSPDGSVNENRFFNGFPDDLKQNLAMIDKLGSPDTYNHYPTGWAVAFSTPYRMFKRYSGYSGGTCDPLVIHWPKGIKARGELRHQYHHCTDIVPTILDCCGLKMPAVVDGIKQSALAGVSMRYSFEKPKSPTRKKTQYYEMIGTRGIWHKGWKACTEHGPLPSDIGKFDKLGPARRQILAKYQTSPRCATLRQDRLRREGRRERAASVVDGAGSSRRAGIRHGPVLRPRWARTAGRSDIPGVLAPRPGDFRSASGRHHDATKDPRHPPRDHEAGRRLHTVGRALRARCTPGQGRHRTTSPGSRDDRPGQRTPRRGVDPLPALRRAGPGGGRRAHDAPRRGARSQLALRRLPQLGPHRPRQRTRPRDRTRRPPPKHGRHGYRAFTRRPPGQ